MNAGTPSPASVSFDDEPLVLVDANDAELGYAAKIDVHRGTGIRHRAFSIFLFDGPERVLLQQRSHFKALWPGFWSNSCCSHPRRGESYEQSTRRRLREELGAEATLHKIYQFEYQAPFGDVGSEYELCSVYVGNHRAGSTISVHEEEIMDYRWVACEELDSWLKREPEQFTPWFALEWRALRNQYQEQLTKALSRSL